jgi:cell wall-associated NlpC family hydrolase
VTGGATASQASPKPVYPSQAQVDAAKRAAAQAGVTVSSLQTQYDAASAHLAAVQDQVEVATEAYNEAKIRLDAATAAAKDAAAAAAAAQQQADDASLTVRRYAALMYQTDGSLSNLEAYLSSTGPQDLADRAVGLAAMGDARAAALDQAARSSNLAASARATATRAQAQQADAAKAADAARRTAQAKADAAAAEARTIAAQQRAMVAKLAQLRRTSVRVERARQAGLEAAAVARARAAAARRAAAAEASRRAAEARGNRGTGSSGTGPSSGGAGSSDPAPHGGVSSVLAYARAQLGKWYQWGGAGPSTFDCSGLTMMAWQKAGVYMPHGSQAQYAMTRRVSIDALQPGDLVFFGASGATNHHVGIYVGGGQMIEAPHTGAQVRYASIYRPDLLPYGGRP